MYYEDEEDEGIDNPCWEDCRLGQCLCEDYFNNENPSLRARIATWIRIKSLELNSFIKTPFVKLSCTCCKKSASKWRWRGFVCPNCKEEDLPF